MLQCSSMTLFGHQTFTTISNTAGIIMHLPLKMELKCSWHCSPHALSLGLILFNPHSAQVPRSPLLLWILQSLTDVH